MGRLNVKVSAEVDWKGMKRWKILLVTVLVAILLVGVGGVDLIGYSVSESWSTVKVWNSDGYWSSTKNV